MRIWDITKGKLVAQKIISNSLENHFRTLGGRSCCFLFAFWQSKALRENEEKKRVTARDWQDCFGL